MGQRHSEYHRADADFYVESAEVVSGPSYGCPFPHTKIHDPCCGLGVIVCTALLRGLDATGADICDRARGKFPVRNFLEDDNGYFNIITNPPDRLAVPIVEHALACS
jgi:hypothetical protein